MAIDMNGPGTYKSDLKEDIELEKGLRRLENCEIRQYLNTLYIVRDELHGKEPRDSYDGYVHEDYIANIFYIDYSLESYLKRYQFYLEKLVQTYALAISTVIPGKPFTPKVDDFLKCFNSWNTLEVEMILDQMKKGEYKAALELMKLVQKIVQKKEDIFNV